MKNIYYFIINFFKKSYLFFTYFLVKIYSNCISNYSNLRLIMTYIAVVSLYGLGIGVGFFFDSYIDSLIDNLKEDSKLRQFLILGFSFNILGFSFNELSVFYVSLLLFFLFLTPFVYTKSSTLVSAKESRDSVVFRFLTKTYHIPEFINLSLDFIIFVQNLEIFILSISKTWIHLETIQDPNLRLDCLISFLHKLEGDFLSFDQQFSILENMFKDLETKQWSWISNFVIDWDYLNNLKEDLAHKKSNYHTLKVYYETEIQLQKDELIKNLVCDPKASMKVNEIIPFLEEQIHSKILRDFVLEYLFFENSLQVFELSLRNVWVDLEATQTSYHSWLWATSFSDKIESTFLAFESRIIFLEKMIKDLEANKLNGLSVIEINLLNKFNKDLFQKKAHFHNLKDDFKSEIVIHLNYIESDHGARVGLALWIAVFYIYLYMPSDLQDFVRNFLNDGF